MEPPFLPVEIPPAPTDSRGERVMRWVVGLGIVVIVVGAVVIIWLSSQSDSSKIETTTTAPASTTTYDSDPCTYLASDIAEALARWAGSLDILNAAISGTQLGLQPDGGVPGILVDGCVWEVRGRDGGHIGVAVERFTDVDMDAMVKMAEDAAAPPSQILPDGRRRWDVPPSGDSPSGAVVIGDSARLVVIRVESHSNSLDRTFLTGTMEGNERFFQTLGDKLESSR